MNEIYWIERGWQACYIGYCPNKKAWKKQMKKMGFKERYPTHPAAVRIFDKDHKRIIILCFPSFDIKSNVVHELGLLVHEVTHVYDGVLEQMQENNPGWEIRAYSMQSIFQEFLEVIEKHHSVVLKWRKIKQ